MEQLVASVSGVVLGGVAMVVGSNLARGKIFTAYIYQRISKRPGSVPVFLRKQIASYAFPGVGSRPPVSPSQSAHG